MSDIDFSFKGTEVFEKIAASTKRITVVRGGTGASKTYSLAQIVALFLFSGWCGKNEKGQDVAYKEGIFSVVRKSLPSLKASAMRDFLEILHRGNLYRFVKHNMTENTFSYKGRMVEFFSVDDQQKVRSRTRTNLWMVEANEMSFEEEFFHLSIRTDEKIYMDFNPDDDQMWINTQLEKKRARIKGDVEVIVCNYTQNPFLSKTKITDIEYLKESGDEDFWNIFGLGEYGHIRGLIYGDWTEWDFPKEGQSFFGLDFGFSNDPCALVEMKIIYNYLYCRELLYEVGLTNWALGELLKSESIKRETIWADSAEPKSIEELRMMGFKINGVKKGPDSVYYGITKVKEYDIRVTERSTNIWMERRRYKWKVNRITGEVERSPVKRFDHLMNAIMYGVVGETTQKTKKPIFSHIRR